MTLPLPTGIPYDPRFELPVGVPRTGVNGCFNGWNRLYEVVAQIVPTGNQQLNGAVELV